MMSVLWQSEAPTAPYKSLRPSTMRDVAIEVAARHGSTIAELRGCSRQRCVAWARQEAFAEIYSLGRFSLPQIGRFFGDRDHTTVLFGIRRHKERLAADAHAGPA